MHGGDRSNLAFNPGDAEDLGSYGLKGTA